MESSHWERLEQLFHQLSELPPEQWRAKLEELAPGDSKLHAEVLSLLGGAGDTASFLDKPAATLFSGPDAPSPEEEWKGQRVGAYRIDGLISSGGMGSVFLASRDDDAYQQQVAIKIVRAEWSGEGLLDRFLTERQTLAGLDHPNIAKLLDGGATEDGRPYLVMEYVDGVPLDQYCREHQLSWRQAVALFRKICQAVAHAHRNLVVHRDLKPQNILVNTKGEPKLLDFGISKVLDPDLGGAGATLSPLRLLTPEYASPEQVRGQLVTTASDVYSIGVVCFEALAGDRPYQMQTRVQHEIERALDSAKVAPPSSLRADIPRDLDAILLKCLRPEPEARYAGMAELDEDLRCLERGLPVAARQGNFAYLTARYLRRYRALVAGIAAILIAITLGVTSTLNQARIAAERGRTAQRVSQFLVRLFHNADPWEQGGEDVPVRRILDLGVEEIMLTLQDEPAERSVLLRTLGEVYLNLGDENQAMALLGEAEKLLSEGRRPDPELLGDTLHHLGVAMRKIGDLTGASDVQRRALATRRDAFGEESKEAASSWNTLGLVYHLNGEFEMAEEHYNRALELRRKLLLPSHHDIATTLSNLASLALAREDTEEALQLFRDALSIQEQRGSDHPDLATAHNNLGKGLQAAEEYSAAFAELSIALEMRLELLGEDHPHVAGSLSNLGSVEYDRGNYPAAEAAFARALTVVQRRLPNDHPLVETILYNLDAARNPPKEDDQG